jgi:hypothetical protein
MTLHIKLSHAVATLAAGAVLVGGGYALASSQQTTIHACVSARTHEMLQESHCGKGYRALTWSIAGPKGERGAKGANGAKGATGAKGASGAQGTLGSQGVPGNAGNPGNTGPAGPGLTAWAQIWMGSSMDEIASGSSSQNVESSIGSGGTGIADLHIDGCSAAGLVEPVIQVTADDDPSDHLTGANNTANTAVAWVAHWSTVPDSTELAIEVQTTNPDSGVAVNSDFSISVTC